jgi:acyl-CoA dehydrogenase
MHDAVYKIQCALDLTLRNFPIRPVAWVLRALVFPLGLRECAPSDRLGHRVASILMAPGEARDRLAEGIYLADHPNCPTGRVVHALPKVIAAEPLERKVAKAIKAGSITALDPHAQLQEALLQGLLTQAEAELIEDSRALAAEVIAVDDFDSADLEAGSSRKRPALRSVA